MDPATIIVLRNRDTVDLDGLIVPVPVVPGAWTVRPQPQPVSGSPFVMVQDPAGFWYHWFTAIDGPDVGFPLKIVGVAAPVDPARNPAVRSFAEASDNAWTLPEFRADGTAPATTIRAAWRWLAGDDDPEPNGTPLMRFGPAGFRWPAISTSFATRAEVE